MKLANHWKCNYCSNVKGENNHWFMVNLNGNAIGFVLIPWCEAAAGQEMQERNETDYSLAIRPQYEHICGNFCAGRALESWLGKQGKTL